MDNEKRLNNTICKADISKMLSSDEIEYFLNNYENKYLTISKLIQFLNCSSRTITSPEAIKLCDFLLSIGFCKKFQPLLEKQYYHIYHLQNTEGNKNEKYRFLLENLENIVMTSNCTECNNNHTFDNNKIKGLYYAQNSCDNDQQISLFAKSKNNIILVNKFKECLKERGEPLFKTIKYEDNCNNNFTYRTNQDDNKMKPVEKSKSEINNNLWKINHDNIVENYSFKLRRPDNDDLTIIEDFPEEDNLRGLFISDLDDNNSQQNNITQMDQEILVSWKEDYSCVGGKKNYPLDCERESISFIKNSKYEAFNESLDKSNNIGTSMDYNNLNDLCYDTSNYIDYDNFVSPDNDMTNSNNGLNKKEKYKSMACKEYDDKTTESNNMNNSTHLKDSNTKKLKNNEPQKI